MDKIKKRLKKIYLKKNITNKINTKNLINKSIQHNNKLKTVSKIILISKQSIKKKQLSFWQNCCFFNALYKQLWHKKVICRFVLKKLNKNASIVGLSIYKK